VAFNAGSFARGLDNRTDAEVVIEALAALRAIYGAAVPEQPAEFVRTRWADDPWALGSYSYYAGAHRVHGVWVLRRSASCLGQRHRRVRAVKGLTRPTLPGPTGAPFPSPIPPPAVGSSPEDRRLLARPLGGGSLLLAGEHVWEADPATVHGALLSGRAQAAAVAKSLGLG
jgi:monoamine oxidase